MENSKPTKKNATQKLSLDAFGFLSILLAIILSLLFTSFAKASTGEEIYNANCAVCHTLSTRDLTGPGLEGLSDRRSEEWIMNWIRNSQQMIADGDEQAVEVYQKFNEVPMPEYPQYTDEEILDIISYINENQGSKTTTTSSGGAIGTGSLGDQSSGGFNIPYWAYALVLLIAFSGYYYYKKLKREVEQYGIHSEPYKTPNYTLFFIGFLGITLVMIHFLVKLLGENSGMINVLMFIVLPYLSFLIFLIGSIYRYKNTGFKVSSLSTQFLEGKKLFYGSLPFHWGLVFLFFGHLIAFLFPATVIAWNGHPWRLLILEFTAFAFGLSTLLGLILLIKRRLTTKKLLMVANKMDMVVYTVLFVQIVSGLGIAYFARWGSSWFASVLTPYLRSVFSFNPDINALVEAPWLVQIHIISAFTIIGIIPFTRFMHFLVAPFDYAWRRYQIVIWNWNPKNIRVSRRHNFGKKPRNH